MISLPPKGDTAKKLGSNFAPLKVEAQATPNMTVKVAEGAFWTADNEFQEYIGGTSPTIAAPGSDAKWVLVTVRTSGLLNVVNGVASGTPDLPAASLYQDELPLAAIFVGDTTTAITNDMIYDLRPLWSIPPDSVSQSQLDDFATITYVDNGLATKAGIAGTSNSDFTLNVGGGAINDSGLYIDRFAGSDVGIRFNETGVSGSPEVVSPQWEFTNDGSSWTAISGLSPDGYYTKTEILDGQNSVLNAIYYRKLELDGGILDNRYYVIGGSPTVSLEGHTHVQADITDLAAQVETVNLIAPVLGDVSLNLNDILDVDPTSPGDKWALLYDNGLSKYKARLILTDDLSDVDTTTVAPVSQDALLYNGAKFVNRPIVKADISDFTGAEFVLTTNLAGDPPGSPSPGTDQDIYGIKTFKEGLVVESYLLVTGDNTTVETNELFVKDPYIDINYGETGPGVGSGTGVSGIRVDRGPADYGSPTGSPQVVQNPHAIIQWDEGAQQWEFGVVGNVSKVLTQDHNHTSGDITDWDAAFTIELGDNDLNTIQDVTYLTAPATGEYLRYGATDWENKDFATDVTTELNANNLDEIADVTYNLGSPIVSLAAGDMLLYTGTEWTNHVPVKADISDFTETDYIHTTGNETKTGNLNINGNFVIGATGVGSPTPDTTTTINSPTLQIADDIVLLNYGESGDGVGGGTGTAGFAVDRGYSATSSPIGAKNDNAHLFWDELTKTWAAEKGPTLDPVALSFVDHTHVLVDITDVSITFTEANSLTGIHTGARAHLGATPTVSQQILDTITRGADDAMDAGFNLSFSGGGEVLGLPATPSATAATSKEYVDTELANKIDRRGEVGSPLDRSVMNSGISLEFSSNGEVIGLPATPSGLTAATSKDYVDTQDAAVQANLAAHAADMGSPQVWHMTADQNTFLDAVATGSPTLAAAEVNTLAGVDTSTTVQTQLDDKISRSGEAGSPLDRSVMNSGISLEFQGGAEPIGLPATPVGSTSATSAAYVDALDAASIAALTAHIDETGSPVVHHMTPEQNTFMDGLSISGSPPGLQADDVNQLIGIDNSQTVQTQLDFKANFINHAGSPLGSPYVETLVSVAMNGDIQDSAYYVDDTVNTTSNFWTADKIDTTKADKVAVGSPSGNFAGLDATGNLTDSGFNDASYADWDHTHDMLGSPETILNFGVAVTSELGNNIISAMGDVIFTGSPTGTAQVDDFMRFNGSNWTNVDAASITEFVHITGTETIGGDKTFTGVTTFSDDVVVNADLTVAGTTTFIDSVNLEVTDKQITLNKGYSGPTSGSNGSGIYVVRNEIGSPTGSPVTALGAVIVWDDTLENFKAGIDGSETEIARVGLTPAQPAYDIQTGQGGSPSSGLIYTLTGAEWNIPTPAANYAAIQIFVNGIKQVEGAGKAYTVSGYGTGTITITFNAGSEPAAGTDIEFYGFGYIG